MGMEPSGRELLVIVIKGTFQIPVREESARLMEDQLPFVTADTFTGEPGLSAPVYEAEFAPRKHRCDVLLVGSCHAPERRPATRVQVLLRVGRMTKSFAVVGDRVWRSSIGGVRASAPQPFTVMPVTYDQAFGGVDDTHEDSAKLTAYTRNPAGKGFRKHSRNDRLDGTPLPNTEELERPVAQPDGDYAPMSFGPVGRGWEPRFRYAGTYDQDWLDNHFPFLPPDFDEAYFQAAPNDQQLPIPHGEQEITLLNLTPDGRRVFKLPHFEAPVFVFPRKAKREEMKAELDTVVIEPDEERLSLTWRVAYPLKRNMLEIAQVLVGHAGHHWWQQREELAFAIPLGSALGSDAV